MHRVFPLALICAWMVTAAPVVLAQGLTSRTVYVTVADEKGNAVPGLTAADFSVKEGGKDREVSAAVPATQKMRLALMVEQMLVGQTGVRVGLAEFAARMCPSAEVALFVVHQRAEKIVDYTSDPNAIVDGIRKMPVGQARESGAVADAIDEVARQFEKAKPERPVIVLAALERGQTVDDAESILGNLAKSKAQFWVVSFGSGSGGSDIGRARVFGDGSRQSGGRRLGVTAMQAFPDSFQQVAGDLSSQYLVTYSLPDGIKPSDRIAVSLNKPGATLRAPSRVPGK